MAFFAILIIIILMADLVAAYQVSSLIVFGDSTADVGNNNYLDTIFKGNFHPYGRDYDHQEATGRFSNGRLAVDFLAYRLGLPSPPAFLSPEAEGGNIVQGISFASAGSGYLDPTALMLNSASFSQQMQWHNAFIKKLGSPMARSVISNGLYLISSGTNDYVLNYYLDPFSRAHTDPQTFQDQLISAVVANIEELYEIGARNIAIVSLPPIGCLPWMRILYQSRNECISIQNQESKGFNYALQNALSSLNFNLPGINLAYVDIYNFLLDLIQNPSNYGFETSIEGCCGNGLLSASILCRALESYTCSDASKYVFWDSFHPTQTTYSMLGDLLYQQIAQQMNITAFS